MSNLAYKLFPEAKYQEYFPLLKKSIWSRPVDIKTDVEIITLWMNQDHVSEFWNMAWPETRIREYLHKTEQRSAFDTYLVFMDDEPIAYFEAYDPKHDILGDLYEVQDGDIGLHVLLGEEKYMRRYIIRLACVMMRLIFSQYPDVHRIIGEPDVNNSKIHSVMRFVGFVHHGNIELPDKTAAFHSCKRQDFEHSHGYIST